MTVTAGGTQTQVHIVYVSVCRVATFSNQGPAAEPCHHMATADDQTLRRQECAWQMSNAVYRPVAGL